jgi:hypothetical protein
MRLISLPAIGFLVVIALPAAARDPMLRDGRFTICPFQNFDKCQLLNERTMRRYRFAPEHKRVLQELKRYAAAPSVTIVELAQSFGKPSRITPHDRVNDKTIAWIHDSVGLNDLNAKCPECGIYVRLFGDVVISFNYIVDRKFTITWYRARTPESTQRAGALLLAPASALD